MSATEYLYLKFSSYAGMFALQAALHSLVAMVLAESAIIAWEIGDPAVRQRFRFLVILVPIAFFPLYQFVDPHRGDVYFRFMSLMDSNRWFFLEPVSGMPVLLAVLAIFALTAAVFFLQELMPIAMHLVEKGRGGADGEPGEVDEASERKVQEALDGLPIGMDTVDIFEDAELVIFSSTGFDPKVHVSTGLAGAFTAGQLRVAIAHEIAHIQRSRKPFLIVAYLLRMIAFYNPVSLVVFRKLAQEEEMVCDDIAVQITGDRESLADAVNLLRPEDDERAPDDEARGIGRMVSAVERYGLDLMLAHRAERIAEPRDDESHWRLPYLVTLASIVGVNYFVV